ncbi:DUF1616 domain-containing protein [Natronolimnohabitans innermongolicus]|uniref:DUF1616 domain-containing protein n=1 Tax=Natronolimnohabitans innermongolicus JCM 12255 TaxID=1227499 RepID=L9XGU6_9EURY|nr:DUF1616 domain-containing protein [Natronolimnohabitans innermongolicus]ELY60621.1 hypothetical protein C493_04071 [Natronolimnohabitans innermongolicus JCM 12255]
MSDNQWWFLDLAAVIAFTGALTLGILSGLEGAIRIALGIPLVCFLPGYALVSVLFPSEPTDEYQSFDREKTGLKTPRLVAGGLEPIERVGLSVAFSIALVPAITLFTSVTPRGIALETVLPGIALLTVGLCLLAIIARYRCPAERRFLPGVSLGSLFFSRRGPRVYDRVNPRPYNVAIAIGLLLLVATAGFALANPSQGDGFTEFAVETENVTGDTETMYESTYSAGETAELGATITNNEHEERDYETVVILERIGDGDGDDENANVTEREELDRASTTVADGETDEQSFEIEPTMTGSDLRLTLLLFEDDAPSEPTTDDAYQTIHLPVDVE